MAEKRVIEIDVNTASAVKNVDLLSQSFEDVYGEIQPLSGRMGELEDQLYELANAGKTGTQEFETLSAEVGRMKKVIQQTDMTVDSLAKTTGQKLGGALSFVSGGFSTFQGAMGAVGVDSAALEESMLKVQSAMAITQGIDSMREGYKDIKALSGDLAKTLSKTAIGQKLVTAAQAAGAVTMKVLNAVMKANPIFLIIGGITALVGAFALFGSSSEDAAEEAERFTKALDKQREAIDENFDSLQKSQARRMELLKAQGASDKKIFEQEQKDTEKNIKSKLDAKNKEAETLRKLNQQYSALNKVGLDDEAEKIKEQITTSANRYRELNKQAKNYYIDLKHNRKVFDTQEKKELAEKTKEDAKELAEKQKEANQKAQQKRDEAKQKKAEELAELAQAQLEATKTANELEIIEIEKKYNKLIAIAKKYGKETKDLEAKKSTEILLAQTKDVDVIAQFIEQEKGLRKQRTQEDIDNSIKALTIKSNLEQKARDDKKVLDEKEAQDRKDLLALQISTVKGGFDLLGELATTFAGKSEAAQRKAFNIQKAASIASALIDTYTAAAGVFRDTKGGLPIRIAATAIAVGSGLARVAQISKTQFNSSNSGGGDTTPSTSLPQEQTTPNFNIVGNAGANPLAQLGNAPLQAYVVSGEVTSAQSLDRNRIKSATL
jgi:hypothetical protein